MQQYVILRRDGWRTPADLEAAGARSAEIADEQMPDDIQWIRSYAIGEPDGQVGTVCIYAASSPEAIRDHANRVGMPATEIIPILDTIVVRPDPERTTA